MKKYLLSLILIAAAQCMVLRVWWSEGLFTTVIKSGVVKEVSDSRVLVTRDDNGKEDDINCQYITHSAWEEKK